MCVRVCVCVCVCMQACGCACANTHRIAFKTVDFLSHEVAVCYWNVLSFAARAMWDRSTTSLRKSRRLHRSGLQSHGESRVVVCMCNEACFVLYCWMHLCVCNIWMHCSSHVYESGMFGMYCVSRILQRVYAWICLAQRCGNMFKMVCLKGNKIFEGCDYSASDFVVYLHISWGGKHVMWLYIFSLFLFLLLQHQDCKFPQTVWKVTEVK